MADDHCRVWVGNLPDKVNDELLYELFLQAGPVRDVILPKYPNGQPKPFGFVTFKHKCSALYAKELFEGTTLFGKEIIVEPKQKEQFNDMPQRNEDGLFSLNSLRGLTGNVATKGRDDLSCNPFGKHVETSNLNCRGMNLLPQRKPEPAQTALPNVPDFNSLLLMGQQLLQGPFGASMMNLGLNSAGFYPSQADDPIMNKHNDKSSRQSNYNSQGHDRDRNWDIDRGCDSDRSQNIDGGRDYDRKRGINHGRDNDRNRNVDDGRDHDFDRNIDRVRDHDHSRNIDRGREHDINRIKDRGHYSDNSRDVGRGLDSNRDFDRRHQDRNHDFDRSRGHDRSRDNDNYRPDRNHPFRNNKREDDRRRGYPSSHNHSSNSRYRGRN